MRGDHDWPGTPFAGDSLQVFVCFLSAEVFAMIKVLVAENIRLLREALVTLLRLEGDIDVVAAVGTGDAIIPAAIRLRPDRSEEHTSELQSRGQLVCRLLLEKKNRRQYY